MANVLEEAVSSQNSPTTTSFQDSSEQKVIQLSVIVPMYNQEKNTHASLTRIKQVLNSMTLSYEIVVVNDGSTDKTLDVLNREAVSDRRIRVVTYSKNMGKGYAVKTGILASQGDLVLFTDGDLDISPYMIADYIRALENCDIVIASKRHPLSKVNAPRSRKFLSSSFNFLVRILAGINIRDTQSGLKAGRASILRRIFMLMLVKRYAFDVEMLAIATALGLNIKEMPVEISLDRRFRLIEILRMLVDLFAFFYRYKIIKYYQKQLSMVRISTHDQISFGPDN